MASRSFKPVSYLASAAAAQQKPSRSPRPSFTRTSSSSSNFSTTSEDSFVATLSSLSIVDANDNMSRAKEPGNEQISAGVTGASSGATPGTSHAPSSRPVETPGRKRSAPIAIELPSRKSTTVYTPLSARGDLPGGYFPNHEEVTQSYKSHPFTTSSDYKPPSTPGSPSSMTVSSSMMASPASDSTLRGPHSIFPTSFPSNARDTLTMPRGKYHPSTYVSPANTQVSTPTSIPSQYMAMPPNSLSIPSATGKRNTSGRPGHERKSSDVKRKLQQYQREMIAQARMASVNASMASKRSSKPVSPRLHPAGSPGAITPLELGESAGYLDVGRRIPSDTDRERELEIMGRMVGREEAMRMSPTARV